MMLYMNEYKEDESSKPTVRVSNKTSWFQI